MLDVLAMGALMVVTDVLFARGVHGMRLLLFLLIQPAELAFFLRMQHIEPCSVRSDIED